MNTNNYFRLNYNYYKRHLSPFGEKVLNVLIQNCHKEQESYKNNQPQHVPVQNKRVLQFRDTSVNRPPQTNKTKSPNEELNINQNSFEETLTSIELQKPIDFDNHIQAETPSTQDLGRSFDTDKIIIHNKELVGKCLDIDASKSIYNKVVKETNTIPWDDIFDVELLVTSGKIIEQSTVLQTCNERPFLFDLTKINNNKVDQNEFENEKRQDGQDTEFSSKDNIKRKKEMKYHDLVQKKPKKAKENTTNLLRKQKYTKAVKNWLNDISPNNPIEEEAVTEKEITSPKTKVNKIIVEKPKATQNKKTKKVIQAQLANKDGIMKFSKPRNNTLGSDAPLENVKLANQAIFKEKKSKAKFIAPIKSQVPVKEITFEIHTVSDNDIRQNASLLNNDLHREYVAVLIYSNNFNQLNCQHTDDSCEVDGLMINICNAYYYFKGVTEDNKKFFQNILEYKLICYGGKDVINYLASKLNMKINPAHIVDVHVGGSLLNPDDPPDNFSEVQKLLSFTPQYTIATECPLQKTAWYITMLKESVPIMTDMLIQQSLWNVFVNIEMRLLPVVAAMEHRGVTVDLEKLKFMENTLVTKMRSVEQSCYKAAGRPFQINSPLQIRAILYDELQLDTKCNVKIRETLCQGAKSTSETMLRSLVSEHPLPRLILEYRHLHKAHATFLAGIAHHVQNGVVKPTWVQTAAVTGRIASNNPNLQAIPKAPFNLVMFPQDNYEDVPLLKFRSVYTSRPGYTLVAADFKHVECRVFAHVAADTSLLDALRSKQDLFRVLAAKWLQKPETEISSEDRERTKRIIYASLYGAGTRKLMDILNSSYDQTLAIVASFNRTFPSLKSFGRSVVSRCEQNGGRLSTICGRVRQFKNIASGDFGLRSQAERQAVNFVVQGSAADLCKMAMIETSEQLANRDPPVEAHLVLQIHDELVWEVRDDHLSCAIVIMKQVMEKCGHYCGMALDLPVEVHTGNNWGEMTEHTV